MNKVTVFREKVHAAEAKSVEFMNREFQFFNGHIYIWEHTVKLTKNSKTYCYCVKVVLNK
jgi:hypothetical protein